MTQISDGIRVFKGSTQFLVIAPHGPLIEGQFQNDSRTGIIAEELHRQLGCTTIINDRYFKPKGPVKKDASQYFLDLYRVDHSQKVSGYIDAIKQVVEAKGKTIVLWVHGIFDHFAIDRGKEHIEQGLFAQSAQDLHALVAYGQGGDPKSGDIQNRFSAAQKTIDTFVEHLSHGGMNTILTHPACNNYRGRDVKRFNQWFLNNGYGFDRVESIQLEIKESGFRDTRKNAIQAANLIARGLKKIVRN